MAGWLPPPDTYSSLVLLRVLAKNFPFVVTGMSLSFANSGRSGRRRSSLVDMGNARLILCAPCLGKVAAYILGVFDDTTAHGRARTTYMCTLLPT